MADIRPFQNGDLLALAEIWSEHWSAVGPPPPVSVAVVEQAILSRTFFQASHLLVATLDEAIVGWCHFVPDVFDETTAILSTVCFNSDGLEICDANCWITPRKSCSNMALSG